MVEAVEAALLLVGDILKLDQNIFLIGERFVLSRTGPGWLAEMSIPISGDPQALFQHDGSVLILLNFLFLPLAQWHGGQLHLSYEVEVLQVLAFKWGLFWVRGFCTRKCMCWRMCMWNCYLWTSLTLSLHLYKCKIYIFIYSFMYLYIYWLFICLFKFIFMYIHTYIYIYK